MRFDDLCQHITGQIIDAIESGATGVWRAPWHHNGQANLFAPVNAVTGNPYSGSNILILALAAIDAEAAGNSWESATWATYRQLQSIGAQVRRGEHGTRCVKWVTKQATDPDNDDEPVGVLVPKVFTVFNVAQTDGYTAAETPRFDTEPIEAAEAFVAATGAKIDVGYNTAKYRPLVDRIQVPAISQYRHAEDYHSVLLHDPLSAPSRDGPTGARDAASTRSRVVATLKSRIVSVTPPVGVGFSTSRPAWFSVPQSAPPWGIERGSCDDRSGRVRSADSWWQLTCRGHPMRWRWIGFGCVVAFGIGFVSPLGAQNSGSSPSKNVHSTSSGTVVCSEDEFMISSYGLIDFHDEPDFFDATIADALGRLEGSYPSLAESIARSDLSLRWVENETGPPAVVDGVRPALELDAGTIPDEGLEGRQPVSMVVAVNDGSTAGQALFQFTRTASGWTPEVIVGCESTFFGRESVADVMQQLPSEELEIIRQSAKGAKAE